MTHDRLPCTLPPIPQPVVIGGVPDGCHRDDGSLCLPEASGCVCDRWTITKDGLGALAGYLAGINDWVTAARGCLEAAP